MRNLVVYLDDDLDNLLAKEKNQNETIRKALRLYYSDIDTSDARAMKAAWAAIKQYLVEIDGKVDFIARRLT